MEPTDTNTDDFKNTLETIRSEYTKAKRLLKNIEEFSIKFEELRKSVVKEANELESNLSTIKISKDEIEKLKIDSNADSSEISSNLAKVREDTQAMQSAYEHFLELKGKLDSNSGEIQTLLDTCKNLQNDIQNTKNNANSTLENTNIIFEEVKAKIDNMQSAYEDFLKIKVKIDDDKTGLNAILLEIQSLKKKSKELISQIGDYKVESEQNLKTILENRDASTHFKESTENNLKTSNESLEQIKNITALITDSGFANTFQKRAKKLFFSYLVWGVISLLGILALTVTLYYLFHTDAEKDKIPELAITIYRLSLTSPLLLLIGFSLRQYSKERDLNERYEFKATTAAVVRNHINFLIDKFSNNEKTNDFAINTFNILYKEPYKNFNSIKLSKKDKEAILDEFDPLNELNKLIKDPKTLKEVLDVVSKLK